MTQEKYGLALGGGSARGLVHLGVIQYLEEQAIEISEVGGTSMGSIIGAGLALGLSSKEMQKLAKAMSMLQLIDFDLSLGFLKGEKVYRFLETIFGEKTFADTLIPLKITATNLETGNLKVFTEGKILDAIRASISLPGIFKPYEIDGNIYIDGGMLCNLPVNLLSSEKIIGVSAIHAGEKKLVRKKNILGFEVSKSFFSLNYHILYRSIMILMTQNEKKSIADTKAELQVLNPELGELKVTDFQKVDEFVQIGYESAKNQLVL